MPKLALSYIYSGGQTGVDTAALVAAYAVGLATGGYMPSGCRRESGDDSDFGCFFGMSQTADRGYRLRTQKNIAESDGTLQIAEDWHSAGELLTTKTVMMYRKPVFTISLDVKRQCRTLQVFQTSSPLRELKERFCQFLVDNNIAKLNVAGNSESTCPGIQAYATSLLIELFTSALNYPKHQLTVIAWNK